MVSIIFLLFRVCGHRVGMLLIVYVGVARAKRTARK